MGYFVGLPGKLNDHIAFWKQASDRISFRNYLRSIGIRIGTNNIYYTHDLENRYKDEFATWLALKRMGVK